MIYDAENDYYLLNDDYYALLAGKEGWEDGGLDGAYHVVTILDDDLLKLFDGSYHGGDIHINNSGNGNPM